MTSEPTLALATSGINRESGNGSVGSNGAHKTSAVRISKRDGMQVDRWFGVELRHLHALAAVAREGSFRGAAESLGYVQSAVSQQIATMEDLVGVRLVERHRGSKDVRLTEPGELLVAHAFEILARVHAAGADLTAHLEGADSTSLRLGISHYGISAGLLGELLRRVGDAATELTVELVEAADDDELVRLLDRGVVDVALADLTLDKASFESHTVVSDSCSLLVRSDARWASGIPPRSADELAELPLIALEGWRYLSGLESWFAHHSLAPRLVRGVGSEATIRALAGAGLGAAIVPSLSVDELIDPCEDRISAIDLRALLPMRRVALHWHGARRQPGLAVLLEIAARTGRWVSERRRVRDDRSEAAAAAPRFDKLDRPWTLRSVEGGPGVGSAACD